MAQQPQKQHFPFLIVCAVFLCVQTMVLLPILGIFNVRTDVEACDCTGGLLIIIVISVNSERKSPCLQKPKILKCSQTNNVPDILGGMNRSPKTVIWNADHCASRVKPRAR